MHLIRGASILSLFQVKSMKVKGNMKSIMGREFDHSKEL
jgi:hypothetical protein